MEAENKKSKCRVFVDNFIAFDDNIAKIRERKEFKLGTKHSNYIAASHITGTVGRVELKITKSTTFSLFCEFSRVPPPRQKINK